MQLVADSVVLRLGFPTSLLSDREQGGLSRAAAAVNPSRGRGRGRGRAFANAVGAATAMGCGVGRNVATLKQVVELTEAHDLNEDDDFRNELLGEHLDSEEVTFLTKMVFNGGSGRMNRVAFQKAVSELLPKLNICIYVLELVMERDVGFLDHSNIITVNWNYRTFDPKEIWYKPQ
ncbi:hypothetical protein F3Y22_tig00112285pilonHSYRG00388 [Hibiscus syriacus]|uniref:Uncharacterized protein n=1 Tax=Hibiscus syriacus TaxID=106335 RepID=A0A6A2XPG7_HIBSY|nr:hypothetical protein F3Y22_tig00112285pilonHSYRG00388 [Hibiscus syriacus]